MQTSIRVGMFDLIESETEQGDGEVVEQTRLDNHRDVERCRTLLLEMTEEDL